MEDIYRIFWIVDALSMVNLLSKAAASIQLCLAVCSINRPISASYLLNVLKFIVGIFRQASSLLKFEIPIPLCRPVS